ncbi:uncharacterized protein PHACADRAFT_153321 [Phanerochaete carnosa HHB-10118-sp]|uniref:Serine/threonine-protein kinase Tel1 n=1 Tax=Phanerochaete carnosa (strain HHB-10118-sp) TaxID=650164 RepID=K5WIG7_PHACS|nr:uncharacterized protein PHACADRAFT_153321 [Phanerochaete carnosa HHB-10118-sp]EKM50032.1 hypothetical protein PHACADRAFT_153321 [Phanerochaete carnosa HHB-10118-sp]
MAMNLEQIINLLHSTKIKERTNGVELLSSLFSVPNKVEKLAESQDLLLLFVALFDCFGYEKGAYTKKSTAGSTTTAENRLKAVARVLRTLVERTCRQWNRKALRVALEHLFENCKYNGTLFEPTALDYFHAIAHIFRFRPHVDNLDHSTWIRLVDLMFNVILEDPFKTRLEDSLESPSRAPSPMDVDEEKSQDEMTLSPKKKRRRPESTPTPTPRLAHHTAKGVGAEVGKIKPVAAEILKSLLTHPSAPLISADYPFLPVAVLNRMRRYLAAFSNKASLHRELLPALSVVLSACSLNKAAPVARFARDTWTDLIDLWKIKDWREPLVIVIRKLFPYLTVDNEKLGKLPPYDASLRALHDCLEKDTHDAKYKTLSLECLRMQLLSEAECPRAFVAKSFRYGWKFTSAQALSWASLELQADCAAKLYGLSRSTLHMEETGRKRARREDPISELLSSIRTRVDVNFRVAHLQVLLFIVDRHWSTIHDELRQSVKDALVQFLSYDEPDIQSWTFMCLAAIAHASCAGDAPAPWWGDIWTHAVREVTIPRVCRAACHVAHTLLTHTRSLISPNKIFSDIETLAKDLTIQGPTFPYDSVCAFLASCMWIASQDVRLYRLQLEEKALLWLLKTWKPTDPQERAKMPSYTVHDIHHFLEVACGARKQVDLICELELPECPIVDTVVEQHATAVIRGFVLYAQLPPFKHTATVIKPLTAGPFSMASAETNNKTEAPPGGKERRLSQFFTAHLEKFVQEGERDPDSKIRGPAIERVRVALDFALNALCFETMVSARGFAPNKRTMQLACKVIRVYIPTITDPNTDTWEDRLFLLAAFYPLVLAAPPKALDEPWEMMLPPGRDSGIRQDVLKNLSNRTNLSLQNMSEAQRAFQTMILSTVSDTDLIDEILDTMRHCLRDVATSLPKTSELKTNKGLDDHYIQLTGDSMGPVDAHSATLRKVVSACVRALATFPLLQSGLPAREKELFELFSHCSSISFVLFGTVYAEYVLDGALHVNAVDLSRFFEFVEEIAGVYECKQDDAFRIMVVSLLRATLDVWIDRTVDDVLLHQVRELFKWVFTMGQKHSNISWRAADAIVQFLDDYLRKDPSESSWPLADDETSETPHTWLHTLAGHVDIRVRFRAVLASARSFANIRQLGVKPMDWYLSIRNRICNMVEMYEEMLTRLVCLGNIMIVSSTVRRGSYWNLLELCFYSSAYVAHVETILAAVSQRLGLSVASFFETYAGQIAIALRVNSKEFLQLPPHLLGYRDMKEYAEAAFPLLTPYNLAASGRDREEEERGYQYFKSHCEALKKSYAEGLGDCLADVVGQFVVHWISHNGGTEGPGSMSLLSSITELIARLGHDDPIGQQLRPYADGILTTVIRTLDEADYSSSGPIAASLEALPDASAEIFCLLTRFRDDTFYGEEAIVPAWRADAVLESLVWFDDHVPHWEDVAITYHVLHHLFAILERHPLVYEQLRLLNAVCMWVACRHEHFQYPALLKTLFNGALNILAQSDLARGAQSILDWIFDRLNLYRASELNLRLAEGLLRIGCVAHEFVPSDVPDTSLMGEDLLQWIEQKLFDLHRIAGQEDVVLEALAAWPRDLNDSLKQLLGHIGTTDLSRYLRDDSVSTNKFRLVRRLHDLAVENPRGSSRFAQSDFWRLKSCIPTGGFLASSDVHAFAELLLSNQGRIDGLEYEAPNAPSARSQHLSSNPQNSTYHAAQVGARKAIFVSLLNMLHDPSTSRAYLAFKTVRSLAVAAGSDVTGTASWPPGYKAELSYLQAYSTPSSLPPSRTLAEVFAPEPALELARNFPNWIKFITSAICDFLAAKESFYISLSAALRSDARLAEEVLPVLVHIALGREWERRRHKTDPAPNRTALSEYFTRILTSPVSSVPCRRVIVDVVLHLRQLKRSERDDPLSHERWLDLDFILLSQSAISYGAYTTALLFTELAAESSDQSCSGSTSVEQVLYEIYGHIDEPDGFYGIKSLDPHNILLKRFHHENQWQKAFQFHGASIDDHFSEGNDVRGVLQALHSFGFNQLALTTLQAVPEASDDLTLGLMAYALGWRTGTWDLPEHSGDQKVALYAALRAVHRERDDRVVEASLQRTLTEEMSRLRSLADENIAEIREVAQNLMCLNEIRRWRGEEFQSQLQAKSIDPTVAAELGDLELDIEYPFLEALIATRVSLLHSARYREERDQIGDVRHPFVRGLVDVETSCLLRLSEASRKVDNVQIALNSVVRAQKLCSSPRFDVSYEYAHVLWLSHEPRSAVQYLNTLLGTSVPGFPALDTLDTAKKALAYATLGTWASEACLEKPAYIMTQYFNEAANLALSGTSNASAKAGSLSASVLHQYAIFAERQYTSIVKSPDAFRWRVYKGRKEEELRHWKERIAKEPSNSTELKRMQSKAQKILDEDLARLQEYAQQRDMFLRQALNMYSRTLQISDEFDDDSMIRFCSLWFANFDRMDDNFQGLIAQTAKRIPSRKFVFLTHQLAARLSKSDKDPQMPQPPQQVNLRSVVLRMCREHPFHTLYSVFCLQGDNKPSASRRQSSRHDPTSSQAERTAAALDIFQSLLSDSRCQERVKAVDLICRASLEWAQYPIKSEHAAAMEAHRPRPSQIPLKLQILSVKDVKVPVITAPLPVDVTCRYDNFVWISRFEDRYSIAGGINVPKITNCVGSDGNRYKQLYKGEGGDDLRQDAVMEQVFDLVNVVLRHDRQTLRRKLRIRGYKVIPLASQAGVLEFVQNTQPLKTWLELAHPRYRPEDISPGKFSTQLREAAHGKKAVDKEQQERMFTLFKSLRTKFKPVMRHFFTEHHKVPIVWFRTRLNYARSVATTSIVGHILGLGDRHTSNILQDMTNGEVVHIDLGIAFDQGKLLPAPERVPFRLTADMVDGLGTSGVDGVFRRCAEETLRVLREEQEVILTVLEVFKYDPLHSWTASEMKLKQAQSRTDVTSELTEAAFKFAVGLDLSAGAADEAADRALSSVQRKLDKTNSVEFTVNDLIQQATDVFSLANMFHGWTPYL